MTSAPPTALVDLQVWPHWVVWRTEERDGKPTKVPYSPHKRGRRASTTDPTTWGTYEQACHARDNGQGVGIGYVFAPDDEYVGVDFDKCVTPVGTFGAALGDTGIHPAVAGFIADLASYTEYSPSGTGLHVILRALFPEGGRNRTGKTPWGGEFECYDRARFFTITGLHVPGTPETIESRTEELAAVHSRLFPVPATANVALTNGKSHLSVPAVTPAMDDVALEEKIRSSKQGPKFAGLFDSGSPEGQESESDLALCNILAFWLGPDEARIDSWMRRSALMRDKWDEKRGDTTYGGYTIDRALEGRTEFYGQGTHTPARRAPQGDDPSESYGDEISRLLGLIDDPVVNGWRSKRNSNARVVFTTRSGAVLDLESWKRATTSKRAFNQEVRMQLGVEADLSTDDISRLEILVGKYCALAETMTVDQRARELGETFLQDAVTHPLDFQDQAQRFEAFAALRERHPSLKAKADGTSIAAESLVLEDRSSGIRYVRVQWFVDYVKANVVSGTAASVMEAIEKPGWWSRPNAQSRFMARHPASGKALSAVLFEVPAGWEHT